MSRKAKMRPATIPGRVAHHGLGDGQPDLVAAALDRDEAVAGRRVASRLERAPEDVRGLTAERVLPGHARDLLGRGVPEHDPALAVDGDDAVGDVREDRDAALPLERDPLVELGVRERRRRVRRQRHERLDLLLQPAPRIAAVHGEDTVQRALGADERHAEVGVVAGLEQRVGGE